jgi:hypothetical protein
MQKCKGKKIRKDEPQEYTSSLADRRAKQLPPHLLCLGLGSSNLLLQIVPCLVDAAKGATDQRRDTPEVIQALFKRAHTTAGITTKRVIELAQLGGHVLVDPARGASQFACHPQP